MLLLLLTCLTGANGPLKVGLGDRSSLVARNSRIEPDLLLEGEFAGDDDVCMAAVGAVAIGP